MSKPKKITFAQIEALVAQEHKPEVITIGNDESILEIPVKKWLSLTDRCSIVRDICDMTFVKDNDTGDLSYAPYLFNFAVRYNLLVYFTDVLPSTSSNRVNEFFENTKFADLLIDAIGIEYVQSIIHDADEMVEYRKSELLKKSKFDDLLESLTTLVSALNEQVENIDEQEIADKVRESLPVDENGRYSLSEFLKKHYADKPDSE